MSLNDSKIRNLKPSSKPVKLSDSHGQYLLVNPGGSRIWYLKYRFNGKESRLSLGAYPLVSLAEARQQGDSVRRLLAQNINSAQQRMAEKAASSPEKHFKTVALAWHKTNKKWSADYATRILASMENHIFPAIGHLLVTTLKTQHFTALLKVIEEKGFLEVASRTRQPVPYGKGKPSQESCRSIPERQNLQNKCVVGTVRQLHIKAQFTTCRLNIALERGQFQVAPLFFHTGNGRLPDTQ